MTDEREIISQLKNPKTQRAAFGLIVRQYSEQLYWLIRRMVLTHDDANDVMQNVFLKAWNHLDSFQGDSKIITWLSRIAINESLDFLRQNNHPSISTEDDPSISQSLLADSYFDGSMSQLLNTSEGGLRASYHIAVKKIAEFFKSRD